MSFAEEIKNALKSATIVEKIIYVNVFLFLLSSIFKHFFVNWFELPPTFESLMQKPWSLISYGFIHLRLSHILSNLLVLYFIGDLFLQYVGSKRFVNFYFLGIMAGAFGFMGYHEFLNTHAHQSNEILIGASAGVSAVFIAMATKMPTYELRIRFVGGVKLWVLTTIWLGLNLLQLANAYKGNAIAHLSGAIFGFIYMTQLNNGNDIGKWFEKLLNFFSNFFKRGHYKSSLKTVHKSNRWKASNKEKPKQRRINDILDKISKFGYEKLSKEEKEYLFRQGKK